MKKVAPSGLKALGHPLPETWTPDDELCGDVKREFGMTDEDIRVELLAFHANHAAAGSYSANWRSSFYMFCKRWKEHRDKQAAPRIELTRQKSPPLEKRPEQFTEAEWDEVASFYTRTGHRARHAGPDPMHVGRCKAPVHILEKHGIDPATGEKKRNVTA